MSHKHHIIPKHAGGTNDPSNFVILSVDDHAEAHRLLFEEYGRWQDYVAWQGLAKLSPKEELVKIRQREAGKMSHQFRTNPFSGIRTEKNFAIDKEHQRHVCALANTEDAMRKKKKTFAEKKHQQKENNSQFGTVWCVLENVTDLSSRKKFNKDCIPLGWISTAEWKDRHKNKRNNAYGRHWYNDNKQNYYLLPNDAKITELQLTKSRLINSKNSVNPS